MEKKQQSSARRWLGLLRNFWVNLLAVILGVLIGVLSKETAHCLIPPGKLYLSLLTMTVLPIVFSAITHSLGQLFRSGMAGKYVLRLVVVFCISVFLSAGVGVLGGLIGNPGGGLDSDQHNLLGKLLLSTPDGSTYHEPEAKGLVDFVSSIVPQNVLSAFTHGKSLAVIFVSILMGISLGVNRSQASGHLLQVVRGLYETFFKILDWTLYALPFGLVCLVAGQMATMGTQYMISLSKVIGIFYLCCGFMCVAYVFAIRLVTGYPIVTILRAFRDPLTLAFVASNSLVAMPEALRHLEEDLGQPADVVELVVPLGIVMNRHAYPVLFALMTVFVAQIYDHPLTVSQVIQASFAAALTGMAAIGPAASVAPMLGLVLAPLGLPTGLAMATLVEGTSLITPIVAMTHLFGSCATATLIGADRSHHTSNHSPEIARNVAQE
jgi:proton glutamate symport protein